jgi:pimeloyl-ACP methyl ester carboxylesterase
VALGIKEWNVYGVSYGADVALQLLRDYPEGTRSVVLDTAAVLRDLSLQPVSSDGPMTPDRADYGVLITG